MVRNAGKFGKAKRGGGRHFSRDLSRLDADGNSASKGGDSSSSEEESSEEEEDPQERIGQLPPIADSDSEEDTSGLVANINSTLSTAPPSAEDAAVSNAPLRTGAKLTADQVAEARKARKAQAKKGTGKAKAPGEDPSDSESEEEVNENKKVGKTMKITDLGAPKEMSRREREQAEKLAAKERYVKMHAAGKTDEAKADLGRLAEIRKQRELAAARRKAETDAKDVASKAALEKSGKRAPLKR